MNTQIMKPTLMLLAAAVLSACGGSGNDTPLVTPPPPPPPPPATLSFEVTVNNLTAGQPLSPIAVVAHMAAWDSGFATGSPVSVEQERLAESGDNSTLLSAADSDSAAFSTVSGSAPIGPGANETISIEVTEGPDVNLSLFTMLVNTNDTVTLLQDIDVTSLAVNASMTLNARSYDAGTEADTETAATIPGPVGGGEGFNAVRDDVRNAAYVSPGVVTADDGLATSALSQVHRWDNPVMRVTVRRTQ